MKLAFPCSHDLDSSPVHHPDDPGHWPSTAGGLWERLRTEEPSAVARAALAALDAEGRFTVECLHERWRVDPAAETVERLEGSPVLPWDREVPFLVLASLVFATPAPLTGEMTAPRELYAGVDPFAGKHAIETRGIAATFGRDLAAFRAAAERLGGVPGGVAADACRRFRLLPKLPVEYLLWSGDDELPAEARVLLDRATPLSYPPDATSVAVNLLTERLLRAAADRLSLPTPTARR